MAKRVKRPELLPVLVDILPPLMRTQVRSPSGIMMAQSAAAKTSAASIRMRSNAASLGASSTANWRDSGIPALALRPSWHGVSWLAIIL